MRPQVFVRRTHLLSKGSSLPAAFFSRPTCNLHRVPQNKLVFVSGIRWSSSTTPPIVPSEDLASPPSQDASLEDAEKPKLRRTRVTTTATKDTEPLELPENLDILSVHDDNTTFSDHSTSLPPPEILEEALNHLLITLHPQTQHRSLYSPGSPVEPSLGLYCPIEGGDYIVDATVQELARRTGAEVLVLDAAQLAAGQWGQFGKAANVLNFPHNPLHFASLPALSSRSTMHTEDDGEDGAFQMFSPPQQMTFTLMTPSSVQNRAFVTRRTAPENKPKVFFDSVVNLRAKQESSELFSPLPRKPRLIYIRDFPLIAPSSSAWYPALLASVRQRRRGPISRPTSPVLNPTTIVFGMTPSLTSLTSDGSSGSANSLMHLLTSKNSSSPEVAQGSKPEKQLWSEGEFAEKARERRLRYRLKRWEKGDSALHEEFPPLPTDISPNGDEPPKPEVIVIGGPNGFSGFPPPSGSNLFSGGSNRMVENKSYFFRSSILVPNVRSLSKEQSTRIARRREINQLTMRMGVGSVGGVIEGDYDLEEDKSRDGNSDNTFVANSDDSMWTGWGNHIEVWSEVKKIADRAVGSVMSNRGDLTKAERGILEPTAIPWVAVKDAWSAHRSTAEKRKLWMKDMSSKVFRDATDVEGEEEGDRVDADSVVDRIKNDPDLDNHEQRLLSCIIDKAAMPTSFSQVHLPPHTIDSVRTIVSLPMLHPKAFQRGILKKHGMTGCLLFGPPGTGKTLIVRALAKEAGCRMLSISPSDVMDMYVGEGEKLVRAVFSLARKLSPCVIFLDEIDALFGARMSARDNGGAFAHRGVITEFMQEMDGLKSSREDNVIVIGATNRPFDLDDAVLRRLPRRLLVDLPGEKEREEILKILLRDESLAHDVDLASLAKKTEGFSGSDLKHLCVAAALDAVKESVLLPWAPDAYLKKTTLARETKVLDRPGSPNELPTSQVEVSLVDESEGNGDLPCRSLELRNFTKALKEIVPSSSEMLGSLSELRKWNEEFGEGRRDRKRQLVWGRGRFGFIDEPQTHQEKRVTSHLDQNSSD